MKKLIIALSVIPLLSSCQFVQEEYYDSGYYNPPPQVEVVRPYRYYQDNRIHRPRMHQPHRGPSPVIIRPAPRYAPSVHQPRAALPPANVVTPRPPVPVVQPNVRTPRPRRVDERMENLQGPAGQVPGVSQIHSPKAP